MPACSLCCQPENICRDAYEAKTHSGCGDMFKILNIRMWANHQGACPRFKAKVKKADGQKKLT
jgi:hypothetical protein